MAATFCAKCGTNNPEGRTTCVSCFALLAQRPGADAKTCSHCGAKSGGAALHCVGCGTKFGAAAPVRPAATSAPAGVAAAAPAQPGRDPLAARAAWDYSREAQPLPIEEEGDLAPISKFVVFFGGVWIAIPICLWLVCFIPPIVVMQFGLELSAALFWGLISAPYLLVQLWVLVDIVDRGGPRWWLAVTFVVPVGLFLYIMMERQD